MHKIKIVSPEAYISSTIGNEKEHLHKSRSQKVISEVIDNKHLSNLLSTRSTKEFRARLRSCSGPQGALVLKAPLAKNRGFKLTNTEFCIWLLTRLGSTNIYEASEPCRNCSKLMSDHGTGYHAAICKSGDYGPVARHNAVRDVLHGYAQKAVYYPRKEVPINTNTKKTPGDLYFEVGPSTTKTAYDITVVHPLSVRVLDGAALQDGYSVVEAERRKKIKYLDECQKHNVKFIPLGIEAFGRFSDNTNDFIQWVATGISNRNGSSRGSIIAEIRRKILFTLIRHYAGAVQCRSRAYMVSS